MRVEAEIKAHSMMQENPRIVQAFTYCYGIENGQETFDLFIDNEFLLADRIKKQVLPEKAVSFVAKQLLEGLADLHEKKIIHRRVNPLNIQVDKKLNAKLMNFESSRFLELGKKVSSVKKDKQAKTIERPYVMSYLPPEYFNEQYSYSFDTWSLGCVIVEMALNKLPK